MSFDRSQFGLENKGSFKQSIILGRVTRIILDRININDPNNSDFADLGEWGAIGCVNFSILYSEKNTNFKKSSNFIARPLFSNIKQYPLIGEIVQIITGPSEKLNDNLSRQDFYYTTPFNTWNSVHHNAFPDLREYSNFVIDNNLKYTQVEEGATQGKTQNYEEFPLGQTFREKSNIKDLLPFEGDVILEGRWGQSIRFGSTVKQKKTVNNWSNNGEDGDPIVIIRNYQGNQSVQEGYVPAVENINVDGSSIYLTHNQTINLQDLSKFPLNSFDVKIKLTADEVIPLQNNPSSFETTSPSEQDINELNKSQQSNKTSDYNTSF